MKVILALGASCTGKSTLCRELSKNHQWKLADTDEFYYQAYPKAQDAVRQIMTSLSEETQECLARYNLTDRVAEFPIRGELHLDNGIKIDIDSFNKESIESLLKEAGVQDKDISLLVTGLREIERQSAATKEITTFRGLEAFFNGYLEHTFAQSFEPEDTVVLDVNPHSGFGPAQILAETERHVESYNNDHPDEPIELFKVIAYCPPLEISRRLQQRQASGYTGNTSTGLYSFEQLSLLVTAVPNNYEGIDVIDTLSPADIVKIIDNHAPEIRNDMETFTKTRNGLSSKFGMHGDTVKLVATQEFPCDAIVDTSKADATTLANTLVDDINECVASRKSASITSNKI